MMKKLLAAILCAAVLFLPVAMAESVPSDQFFQRGKDALNLIASGDTAQALGILSFQYEQPGQSDAEFAAFLKDYLPGLDQNTVQKDVAVCYWEAVSGQYLLAIPISEPKNENVMALVLMSRDFETFTGYAALTWREVGEGTASSQYVWWNVEYTSGASALYAD